MFTCGQRKRIVLCLLTNLVWLDLLLLPALASAVLQDASPEREVGVVHIADALAPDPAEISWRPRKLIELPAFCFVATVGQTVKLRTRFALDRNPPSAPSDLAVESVKQGCGCAGATIERNPADDGFPWVLTLRLRPEAFLPGAARPVDLEVLMSNGESIRFRRMVCCQSPLALERTGGSTLAPNDRGRLVLDQTGVDGAFKTEIPIIASSHDEASLAEASRTVTVEQVACASDLKVSSIQWQPPHQVYPSTGEAKAVYQSRGTVHLTGTMGDFNLVSARLRLGFRFLDREPGFQDLSITLERGRTYEVSPTTVVLTPQRATSTLTLKRRQGKEAGIQSVSAEGLPLVCHSVPGEAGSETFEIALDSEPSGKFVRGVIRLVTAEGEVIEVPVVLAGFSKGG